MGNTVYCSRGIHYGVTPRSSRARWYPYTISDDVKTEEKDNVKEQLSLGASSGHTGHCMEVSSELHAPVVSTSVKEFLVSVKGGGGLGKPEAVRATRITEECLAPAGNPVRIRGCPVRSLVTIPTELPRLQEDCSVK